jgi:hypothetical protein
MQREAAETVGVHALGWLAGNDELLPVFLGSTGASLDDLRAGAGDAAFLASVLDFVMMDDAWVVAFCDAAGIAYTVPLQARAALPGGAVTHWT